MDFQGSLESKTEETAREAVNASKKLFAFAVKAQGDMLDKTFSVAAFIPKNILEGLSEKSTARRGKQSIKTLIGSGAKLENIPIDKDKKGTFESVARKYGVDYSFKKAVIPQGDGGNKEQHYIFFKAKDINVLSAAFKEFTAKAVENERKKAVKARIKEERQAEKPPKSKNRERKREKRKDREESL